MNHSNENIAVIGAGLAGLTVAYRLKQKGYDVHVYEARPRVGGRVHSALIKNLTGEYSVAELGGQNITDGGEANHICSLAKELDLEVLSSTFQFSGLFFDGKQYYDRAELLSQLPPDILQHLPELAKACDSLQEILDQLLEGFPLQKRMISYMLNAYEGLAPNYLSTQPHNLNTLKFMLQGGVSQAYFVTQVDTAILRSTLKGGNAQLPLKLQSAIKENVSLQKVLEKVILQSENEILLQFVDKSQTICQKLILALPCSVFKDIDFDPRIIEPEKLEQINAIQYGNNSKIILPIQFDNLQQNWIFADNFGAFRNVDKHLLTLYFLKGSELFSSNFQNYHDACDIVKNGFENSILDDTLPQVPHEQQLTSYQCPLIKSWGDDPFAKGSYSAYGTLLKDKIDQKILYKGIECKKIFSPIKDKIFFVGEHATVLDEIGTMEAAVESAERMARCF